MKKIPQFLFQQTIIHLLANNMKAKWYQLWLKELIILILKMKES
jgi:hypothetical protein